MKLHALHIQLLMPHGHDIPVCISCSDHETGRQLFFIHDPAMVSSHFFGIIQSFEDTAFIQDGYGRGNTMINRIKVDQRTAESLADGLVTQAYTQYGFGWRIHFYQWQQQPCFPRYARTGRQNDLVVYGHFLQSDLVVAEYIHLAMNDLLHEVHQVVGEGIIIIKYQYPFHAYIVCASSMAFLRAPNLLLTSCSSFSGLLAATTPAPAW